MVPATSGTKRASDAAPGKSYNRNRWRAYEAALSTFICVRTCLNARVRVAWSRIRSHRAACNLDERGENREELTSIALSRIRLHV